MIAKRKRPSPVMKDGTIRGTERLSMCIPPLRLTADDRPDEARENEPEREIWRYLAGASSAIAKRERAALLRLCDYGQLVDIDAVCSTYLPYLIVRGDTVTFDREGYDDDPAYRLDISDHGNVTLYRRRDGREVWGIV